MQQAKSIKLAAVMLLLLPLVLYVVIYLAPLFSIAGLSVDNSVLGARFPTLSQHYTNSALIDDDAAAALLIDLQNLSARDRAETARLFNQELGGMRTLVMEAGKAAKTLSPTLAGLTELNPRWADRSVWDVIERNVSPITWRHFQKATGIKATADGSYAIASGDDIYLRIMGRTLVIALQVTLLALLIGYPLAYAVANGSKRTQAIVLMAVLLSFWTSILVRTTAWVVLLQTNGLLNGLLMWLHIISEPLQLIFNRFGSVVAMTHVLMPFAILPMINVMRTIPAAQVQASRSLGAGPVKSFFAVYFPQSLRGVLVGGGTVFILSLGFYVTPALTGGPGDQMLSYHIAEFVKRGLNWGMASALSILLLGCVLLLLGGGALLRRALGWNKSTPVPAEAS